MFVPSFVVACGPVRSLGRFCPFLHMQPSGDWRKAKGQKCAPSEWSPSVVQSMRDLVSSSPNASACLAASCLSALGKTLRFLEIPRRLPPLFCLKRQ
jgi:hypothetical protein